MNTEVIDKGRVSPQTIMAMGVFGVGGLVRSKDRKLLMAPKTEEVERFNFDPIKEIAYLKQFGEIVRRQQLEVEMATSLTELFLCEFSHDYLWDGVKIVDRDTGISVRSLAENCEYEKNKTEEIEKELRKGEDLVVRVSPKNKELDYPDDMVDFWVKGEGEKLTWMRFKVDMDLESLKEFDEMDKEGYRMADLVEMLSLAEENKGTSMRLIEKVTRSLRTEFERAFGEKIYTDGEMMTRMYVAIRLEVERRSEEAGVETKKDIVLVREVLRKYLYGRLTVKKMVGGGCSSTSQSGEFASVGIIIVKTSDGISFRKGSTEGLNYCRKCGCWYSGEKCPICD